MFCLYTLPLARPAHAKIQMLTTSSWIVTILLKSLRLYLVNVKSTVKIWSIFVAFLEKITLHALSFISSLWLYLTRWLDSGTKMWIAQKNVRAKRLQTLSSSRLDCYRVCPLAACHISIIFLPRYLSYLKAWSFFFPFPFLLFDLLNCMLEWNA